MINWMEVGRSQVADFSLERLKEGSRKAKALVHLDCCQKNTGDWLTYQYQKFASSSSGDYKVKIKVDSISGEGALPGS
jgi:hypothetical protein